MNEKYMLKIMMSIERMSDEGNSGEEVVKNHGVLSLLKGSDLRYAADSEAVEALFDCRWRELRDNTIMHLRAAGVFERE